MDLFGDEKNNIKPVLVIDELGPCFGKAVDDGKIKHRGINASEEAVLTLFARVIVEIIIKEEL